MERKFPSASTTSVESYFTSQKIAHLGNQPTPFLRKSLLPTEVQRTKDLKALSRKELDDFLKKQTNLLNSQPPLSPLIKEKVASKIKQIQEALDALTSKQQLTELANTIDSSLHISSKNGAVSMEEDDEKRESKRDSNKAQREAQEPQKSTISVSIPHFHTPDEVYDSLIKNQQEHLVFRFRPRLPPKIISIEEAIAINRRQESAKKNLEASEMPEQNKESSSKERKQKKESNPRYEQDLEEAKRDVARWEKYRDQEEGDPFDPNGDYFDDDPNAIVDSEDEYAKPAFDDHNEDD